MKACQEYQAQLLDQLYDLLEEAEAAELSRHLAVCPLCRRAAEEARGQRQTLARAARMESAPVSFKPPQPWYHRPIRASWTAKLRLFAAAALVLAAAGVGVYSFDAGGRRAIDSRYTRLVVQGPSVIVPGAPRTFTVKTQTPAGRACDATVSYRLVNPKGEAISSGNVHSEGTAEIGFPVGLDIPAGSRLEVSAAGLEASAPGALQLDVAPRRYLTQISTDKPMYRPGEAVMFRSLTLERYSLRPDREQQVCFTIRSPRGSIVYQNWVGTNRGVAAAVFPLDAGLPGGEYTVEAASAEGLFAPEKRSFTVQAYRLPRLKKELKFTGESYGPGQTAAATLSVERTEGGPAARAKLTVTATVDGKEVYKHEASANAGGAAKIEFPLPKEIERGEGLLSVAIDDGGTVETAAKAIPIALNKLDVSFCPEGGDLVAGLVARCYFAARTTLGKPAALKGWVVDGSGSRVTRVETVHKGLGTFTFTPRAGESYKLAIDEPEGIEGEHPLPAVKSAGLALRCPEGVTGPGGELPVIVSNAYAEPAAVAVAVHCRGTLVGQDTLSARPGENRLSLRIDPTAHGVMTVTVYDRSVTPVAERLVYRRSERRLDVRVESGLGEFSPGQKVRLALRTYDENGTPVPAALGISVVDEGLLNLAAEDAPSMVTHFMLTTEVEKPEDLEEADFYLAGGAKAAGALDLLLGTQGWRRFAWMDPNQFVQKHGDDARHLLAMAGFGSAPAVSDNLALIGGQLRADLGRHEETIGAWKTAFNVGLASFALAAILVLLAGIRAPRVRRLAFSVAGAAAGCAIVVGLFVGGSGAMRESPCASFAGGTQDRLRWEAEAKAPMPMPAAQPAPPMDREKQMAARGLDFKAHFALEKGLQGDAVAAGPVGEPQPVVALVAGGKMAFEERRKRELFWNVHGLRHADGRVLICEYAHAYRKQPDGARRDFAETLFWNPLLVTDEQGRAEFSFDLCDSVTAFLIRADAHSGAGRLGTGSGKLVSRVPFYMEPKLPVELTFGDRLDLPLAVVNATGEEMGVRVGLAFPAELLRLSGGAEQKLELAAGKRGRLYFPFEVVGQSGEAKLLFSGAGGLLEDKVERGIPVVPHGFPRDFARSGILEKYERIDLAMPEEVVPGTLKVQLKIYPSPLATLQDGGEGMLHEPGGCFEQATSTNYPNVMLLQFMGEQKMSDPKIAARAKQVLGRGYQLLTGYECKQKGYEWFGADPGHVALTAFGLMEFKDMAEVYSVDQAMIERTSQWLMRTRDGQGGFTNKQRPLHTWVEDKDITAAYATWALTEAGQKTGLDTELAAAAKSAAGSKDPYLVALAANALLNAGRDAKDLLAKLAAAQQKDGSLTGTKMSVTCSTGINLTLETTALAALAWMKSPAHAGNAVAAVEWLNKNRQASGRYGATQATVLVLKALIAYAKTSAAPDEDGTVTVLNAGKEIARLDFTRQHRGPIGVAGLEGKLRPGKNRLELKLSTRKSMPYTLAVNYTTPKPPSDEKCAVRLTTTLAKTKAAAGESVRLDVTVRNVTDQGLPMTTAIVGLPAGLVARADELKELVKQGKADFYETRNREVIFYWRALTPGQEVKLAINPVAEIPGSFTGPASRVYLYYTDDLKWWVDPVKVEIAR